MPTLLKHTVFNELSNARNTNNMAILQVMFNIDKEVAPTSLALVSIISVSGIFKKKTTSKWLTFFFLYFTGICWFIDDERMLFESITCPFEGNCEVFEVWHQLADFLPQSDEIAGKNEDHNIINIWILILKLTQNWYLTCFSLNKIRPCFCLYFIRYC